jgi:hypothetical protein
VNDWSLGVIGTIQTGRPWPLSTGETPFATVAFAAIGNEVPQRPNVEADGTLNVNNIAGSRPGTLLLGPNGQAMCQTTAGQPCASSAFTFLAPADASANGAVDSLTGDIVDFRTITGNLQRDAGVGDHYTRFDISVIKAFRLPKRESARLELKLDVFDVFNHPLFVQYNGHDTLNALKVSANPNCRSCLNAVTGHFVGSGGQVLTIQDLRSGMPDSNVNSPIFGGIGDAAATDAGTPARILQVGARLRW